jgi:cell shape-determining protein MreC
MKYNIFQVVANQLPEEFKNINVETQKIAQEQRITELEEENKILKAQLDIIMKLKG